MYGAIRTTVLCGVLVAATSGCAGVNSVRYVYQDGQSGVIGVPENTSRWPTYYRKHAEELMAKHFPDGYEVVRAEEVVEGSRTLTVHGTNSAELDPMAGGHLLAFAKVGRTSERSRLDTVKIKECRIIYKKSEKAHAPAGGDYAAQASWTPQPYLDANAIERRTVAKPVPPDPPQSNVQAAAPDNHSPPHPPG